MQLSFNDLQYVIGSPETVEQMQSIKPLRPFDDDVIAFFNEF